MEQHVDNKSKNDKACIDSLAGDSSEEGKYVQGDTTIARKDSKLSSADSVVNENIEALHEGYTATIVHAQNCLPDLDAKKNDPLYNNIVNDDGCQTISASSPQIQANIYPPTPPNSRNRELHQSQDSLSSGIKKPVLAHLKSSSDPESTSCSDSPSSSSRQYAANYRNRTGPSHVTFGGDTPFSMRGTNDVRDAISPRSLKSNVLPTTSQRDDACHYTSKKTGRIEITDSLNSGGASSEVSFSLFCLKVFIRDIELKSSLLNASSFVMGLTFTFY